MCVKRMPDAAYFADGRYLSDRGIFVVLNQVFRTLLHSRLKLGIQRYLDDDRFEHTPARDEFVRESGIRSVIAAPRVHREVLVGAITVYGDRSFTFITKTPPASFLIKKAAKLKSGSKEPGKISAGKIARSKLTEIAQVKMADLNANDLEAATKIIEGSARAMGLEVVEG